MKLRALVTSLPCLLASLAVVHCGGDDASSGAPDASAPDTASAHDAGSHADATAADSAIDDASPIDATSPEDGSRADASPSDASPSDASQVDASQVDASQVDATSPDASACGFDESADGTAHLLGIYTLPATSMRVMLPYLTQQDLTDALTNGAVTVDAPGPGSGLEYGGGCTFYGVGDRGPNADHGSGNEKAFPMPTYTPTVMKLRLDPANQALLVDGVVNFMNSAAAPATGLPNGTSDETPFLNATSTTPLPYDEDGIDTEDLRRMPNGDFVFSEEYSPSIGVVDGATGKIKVRYVPTNVSLPNAHYPVKAILPAVLTNRRSNKGLEGLALSADGKTAYAVLQAPMGDETTYGASRVNRVIRVEHIDDPNAAAVTGHFIVLHAAAATAYPGVAQKKIFYNSATWLSADKLLLLERGPGHLHLIAADFSSATNLVGKPAMGEGNLDPESVAAGKGYAALGITPATTTDLFTSDDTPTFITTPPNGAVVPDKLEGLAVINKTTVAISNDNDFGVANAQDRSRIWILRLKAPLPM